VWTAWSLASRRNIVVVVVAVAVVVVVVVGI